MLNIKRKFMSLMMTAAMIMTLFAGMTVSASAFSGSGTENDPYLIASQSDLEAITNLSAYYKLSNNITLDSTWNGLGSSSIASAGTSSPYETGSAVPFNGTLDGNGKTVTVNRSVSTDGQGGVVNYLGSAGTVKNLNVAGSVSATGSVDAIGGVVGYNSGVIDKVTSSVTVSAGSAYNVGGIAGFNNGYYNNSGTALVSGTDTINGYILNCANTGNVTGYCKVGGITGENSGTVNSCSNTVNIVGKYNSKNGVGGIVGRNGNNNSPVETGYIWNCYNTGDIICSSTGEASTVSGNLGSWVGGIAGFSNGYSVVANSFSTGNVNAYAYRDYIVGKNEGTVSNNYAVPGSNTTGYFAPQGYDYAIVLTAAQLAATDFYQTLGVSNTARWQNGTTHPTLTKTALTSDYSLVPSFTYAATTTYSAGQSFNNDGSLVVTAVYHDSTPTTATVPATDYTFSPTGALTTSNNSVSVTGRYKGVPISISIPITVGNYSFALTTSPTTTTYTAGQTFNASGAVVTVSDINGVVTTITSGFTLSQTGPLTTTDTSIALSGTYDGEDFSVNVPITVNAASSATLGTGYFTDLERALDAVSSGGTITVLNPIDVNVSGTVTRNDNVTITRGSGFSPDGTNTALFNLTGGTLRLTTMTIQGGTNTGSGTLFNVTGGNLVLRGNAKLQKCATAVYVNGGTVTVNKAIISDCSTNSINVNTGNFILEDFGGTSISGSIYLSSGTHITAKAVIPEISISLPVGTEYTTIVSGTENYPLTSTDEGNITCSGYSKSLDEDNNVIDAYTPS